MRNQVTPRLSPNKNQNKYRDQNSSRDKKPSFNTSSNTTEIWLSDGTPDDLMKSCDYLDPPLTKWGETDDMAGNVLGTEKYRQEERTEMAVGNYVRSHGDLPLGGFEFSAPTNFYGMAPSVFDVMKFAYLKVLEECFNFETGPPIDISFGVCLLYTSPSPRDLSTSRMPSSA